MHAAIFQCAGGGLTFAQRLAALDQYLLSKSVELVVCPELFASGYHLSDGFSALAQTVDGCYFAVIAKLAMKHKTAIVYGYPEVGHKPSVLYNSAAFIGADGALIANHRKLLLPPGIEQAVFSSGDELSVFDYQGLRYAILICYDAEYPESVRKAAQLGAQVLIVPTALAQSWGSVATQMMPTRAFENGVWLLYANHAGEENGLRYFGGSCIIAPDGSDVARAGGDQTLISATLSKQQVAKAQARLPYLQGVKQLLTKI